MSLLFALPLLPENSRYVGRNRIRLRGITEGFARGNKRQPGITREEDVIRLLGGGPT